MMTLVTLWFTTLAVCIVGAIIPFVNTEIYLLSVSALSPAAFIPSLVVAAALGQMLGKVVMYYGGRGVPRIRSQRVQRGVASLRTRLEASPRAARLLLFGSATIGIPPLYLMAIACGTVGMGLGQFFVIGSVGRLIHFAVVAYIPQLAKGLISQG